MALSRDPHVRRLACCSMHAGSQLDRRGPQRRSAVTIRQYTLERLREKRHVGRGVGCRRWSVCLSWPWAVASGCTDAGLVAVRPPHRLRMRVAREIKNLCGGQCRVRVQQRTGSCLKTMFARWPGEKNVEPDRSTGGEWHVGLWTAWTDQRWVVIEEDLRGPTRTGRPGGQNHRDTEGGEKKRNSVFLCCCRVSGILPSSRSVGFGGGSFATAFAVVLGPGGI